MDPFVFLVVFNRDGKPVLFLEAKDDSWAGKAELRHRADQQMRDRYALMLDESATLRLWGIGALGTSMRVYCGDLQTLEVEPQLVPRPQPTIRILPPNFLAGEWNLDVLSRDGFDKMKEIVADIMAYTPYNRGRYFRNACQHLHL